jgi:hypothetical protein
MTVHYIGFQAVFNITILVHTRKIQTILVQTRKRKLGHHVHGTPETSKLNFIWSDRSTKRIEKVSGYSCISVLSVFKGTGSQD